MTYQTARTEHSRLCKVIEQADKEYFEENSSKISDVEYDDMLRRLRDLEKEYPRLASKDSPTNKVGGGFKPQDEQVKHDRPMLSLDKVSATDGGEEGLRKFFKHGRGCVASIKVDGLAASLLYEGGQLVRVATRGDGTTGEDITRNADLIAGLPHTIKSRGRTEIRGELVIEKHRFAGLNKARQAAGEEEFTNLRNAVAGIMRQKHRSIHKKAVTFVPYDLHGPDRQLGLEEDLMRLRDKMMFFPPYMFDYVDNADEALDYIHKMEGIRDDIPYEIDGIVFRINSHAQFEDEGYTSRAPRGAVAWKFAEQAVQTTIENIEYQLGRTGVLTPVACLKPVKASGAKVSKATLHNIRFMKGLGLKKDDTVTLVRSGEVIPKITGVLKDKRFSATENFDVPEYCPSCDSKLIEDGVDLKCIHHDCHEVRLAVFKHFCGRDVMNIKGISGKTLEKILRSGKVRYPADLFALTLDDFIQMNAKEGTTNPDGEHADAKAKFKAIDTARNTTLAKVLTSIGIQGLGRTLGKKLAKLDDIEEFLPAASVEQLTAVEGMGRVTAQNIYDFFHSKHEGYVSKDHLQRLKANGVLWSRPTLSLHQAGGSLSGLKCLITGSVEGMTREEANENIIVANGGEVASSVSSKLDLLILGNKPGGSKVKKAEGLGIKMQDVKDFQ